MVLEWLVDRFIGVFTGSVGFRVVRRWHFELTPQRAVRAFQKQERNNLSQSETMLLNKLFLQNQWSKKITARSLALMSIWVGINQTSAPRWSVIVRQSYPQSNFKGPIKSIATEEPLASGTGRGCNGPGALVVAWFISLVILARRNVSLLKIVVHIQPIIGITKYGITLVSTKMAQRIMCKTE